MEGKKNEDGAKNPINLEPQFDRGVNYFQMVKKNNGVYMLRLEKSRLYGYRKGLDLDQEA